MYATIQLHHPIINEIKKKKKKNMKETQLKVLMHPWLAMGHFIPYLHLANKYAERGHIVTLLLPNKAKNLLQSKNLHPSFITLHTITIPHVHPLPPGTETASDIPFHLQTHLATALDLTRVEFESILVSFQPNLVVYDFTYWVPEAVAASGSQAKCVAYSIVSAVAMAFTMVPSRDPPKDKAVVEEDACVANAPPGYPSSTVIIDPRTMIRSLHVPFGEGVTFYERITTSLRCSDAIAIKTCREIEGKYCDFLSKQFNKPILLSGLDLPKPNGPSETILEAHWTDWLSQFSPRSVVFCVFGSQVILDVAQFQELLLGFEMTNLPFLVAFKPPTGYATVEEAFPEGFGRRVGDRGVVTGEWVQQPQILAHPSVGCFVSHCGSGSIWECMMSKNQIVLMPQLHEQFLFTKIFTTELKVAVEVERGEDGMWVSRESLSKAIKSVMGENSEISGLVKKNHEIWRQKLAQPVLMSGYFDKFVKDLQVLVSNNVV
ncbi:UDP-glycosyltransferase 79B6-like [Chenopodium quinoa]|uniref:UDP-glycosyltransferase 79B6-like n=1 Tax=Chenopodium quinoa TaxID=63459 RepID=UPI000B78CDB2|nr:UDP-glycosyltransferase 79B6-like [Chenopodium quinoa]